MLPRFLSSTHNSSRYRWGSVMLRRGVIPLTGVTSQHLYYICCGVTQSQEVGVNIAVRSKLALPSCLLRSDGAGQRQLDPSNA